MSEESTSSFTDSPQNELAQEGARVSDCGGGIDATPAPAYPVTSVLSYIEQAKAALAGGNKALAVQLFLSAYHHSLGSNAEEAASGIAALKSAWNLAFELKERPLVEYSFELLKDVLPAEEVQEYAERMRELALDKLEELGVSRKDIEEIEDMIPQTIFNGGIPKIVSIKKVDTGGLQLPSSVQLLEKPHQQTNPVPLEYMQEHGAGKGLGCCDDAPCKSCSQDESFSVADMVKSAAQNVVIPSTEHIDYQNASGFETAVKQAREMGVGRGADPHTQELISSLNAFHGLSNPPANPPLFIVGPSREDANRFALVTIGELSNSCIRMSFEDGPNGTRSLVMSAPSNNVLKFNKKASRFEGSGVLFIQDIDEWLLPNFPEGEDGSMPPLPAFFAMQSAMRGIKEAFDFIKAAIEDVNVEVVVTAENIEETEPALLELFEPFSVLTVDLPNAGERASLWMSLTESHQSLRGIDSAKVVRLTANMSRYDIVEAMREALEETYIQNIEDGECTAVPESVLFDKLAAYQPLNSEEYKALEDAVVDSFRGDLDSLESLLKGE